MTWPTDNQPRGVVPPPGQQPVVPPPPPQVRLAPQAPAPRVVPVPPIAPSRVSFGENEGWEIQMRITPIFVSRRSPPPSPVFGVVPNPENQGERFVAGSGHRPHPRQGERTPPVWERGRGAPPGFRDVAPPPGAQNQRIPVGGGHQPDPQRGNRSASVGGGRGAPPGFREVVPPPQGPRIEVGGGHQPHPRGETADRRGPLVPRRDVGGGRRQGD